MQEFFSQLWQIWCAGNLPGVIGAIIIMLIGWLIAIWLAGRVARLAGAFSDMGRKISGGENDGLMKSSGSLAGKITFYGVMLLVVLAAMSLLRLEYAAVPLREFVTVIAGYLPNIAGALLLLFLAWFIAGVVRNVIAGIVEKHEIAERMEKHFSIERHHSRMLVVHGSVFMVYLFFLPAILNALGIYGITAPLQAMFAVILLYLPRFFAAVLLLIVGFWAAKVVRKAVTAMIVALKVENFSKWCGLKEGQLDIPARIIGIGAWLLVVFPVITGALNVLGIDSLSAPAADFFTRLLMVAGLIICAVFILLAAFFIGRLIAGMVENFTAAHGVDTWMEKIGLSSEKFQEYRFFGGDRQNHSDCGGDIRLAGGLRSAGIGKCRHADPSAGSFRRQSAGQFDHSAGGGGGGKFCCRHHCGKIGECGQLCFEICGDHLCSDYGIEQSGNRADGGGNRIYASAGGILRDLCSGIRLGRQGVCGESAGKLAGKTPVRQ